MIEETDTIAAVATGEGASGVAVLRVSGPRALSMAGALARLPPEHLRHGQMRLRWLRAAGGERVDRGVHLTRLGIAEYATGLRARIKANPPFR